MNVVLRWISSIDSTGWIEVSLFGSKRYNRPFRRGKRYKAIFDRCVLASTEKEGSDPQCWCQPAVSGCPTRIVSRNATYSYFITILLL